MHKHRLITSILAITMVAPIALAGCSSNNNKTSTHVKADSSAHGFGADTTGGTKADSAHTYYVNDAKQLKKVLSNSKDKHPRKVIITGTIDPQKGIKSKDYAKGTGYNFKRYLSAYNPKKYGYKKPKGTQENARKKAQKRQEKNIKINVPANTTITGTKRAYFKNTELNVEHPNVIISNLKISAPVDEFPQWDGTDGKSGNWNSQYDAVSVRKADHVKIVHNTLTDAPHNDNQHRNYYGHNYQQHDGLTDITNGSDYVMVADNLYRGHDKTMLIGNSDSRTSDKGTLNVSIVHNEFDDTVQRTPRVRFGHVDVIDNTYKNDNKDPYRMSYAWGLGVGSHIFADHNSFDIKDKKFNLNHIVETFKDFHFTAEHTKVNGKYRKIGSNLSQYHQKPIKHKFSKAVLNGRFGQN